MKDISTVSDKISTDLRGLTNQVPGGKIPYAASFAELKGKLPNPKTLKAVFKPGASIPKEFLKDFDPTTDLVSKIGIPEVKIDIPQLEFKQTEPKIEAAVNTEGLSEKEIAKANAKRAARQKLNNKAADVQNSIKDKAKSAAGNQLKQITGGIQNKVQGAVKGAVAGALASSPLGGMLVKLAAFKFFKAQIMHSKDIIGNLKADLDKNLKEGGKDVMKGMTNMKKVIVENKKKKEKLKAAKEEAAAKAASAQSAEAAPADVKSAGQIDPETTANKEKTKQKFEAFAANLKQTAENVGKVVSEIFTILKGIMKMVLSLIAAVMAIVAFIMFLMQLLAMLMMMFLKKDSKSNSGSNKSPATENPEQFLEEIGYPGYGVNDFDTLIEEINNNISNINVPTNPSANIPTTEEGTQSVGINTTGIEGLGGIEGGLGGIATTQTGDNLTPIITTTKEQTQALIDKAAEEGKPPPLIDGPGAPPIKGAGLIDSLSLEELTEPLIIGSTQIGHPLTIVDLDSKNGKNFSNHPILGDISDIHPQFINELYNDGILTTKDPVKELSGIDPNNWTDQLGEYYDSVLQDLEDANQIEYIEHLYNLKSQLVGYRRYKA